MRAKIPNLPAGAPPNFSVNLRKAHVINAQTVYGTIGASIGSGVYANSSDKTKDRIGAVSTLAAGAYLGNRLGYAAGSKLGSISRKPKKRVLLGGTVGAGEYNPLARAHRFGNRAAYGGAVAGALGANAAYMGSRER